MPAPSSRAAARLIARGAGLSLLAAATVPAYLTIAPAWRPLAARLGCAALVAIGCLRARAWARDALGAAPAGGVDAPPAPAPEVALDPRFLRLRLHQLCPVALGRRAGLVNRRLRGARINPKQHLALFNVITLLEHHGLEHAAYLRANCDAVFGFDRSHGIDDHRHRLRRDAECAHRQRPTRSAFAGALPLTFGRFTSRRVAWLWRELRLPAVIPTASHNGNYQKYFPEWFHALISKKSVHPVQ